MVVFISIVLIHSVNLFPLSAAQLLGVKQKSPSFATPCQNYILHKIKIHKKDNSSIKPVPTNIVTMYVVFHIRHGKRIWCITSGHAEISNSDKAIEDTKPKHLMENIFLVSVIFLVLTFYMIWTWKSILVFFRFSWGNWV